MHFAFAQPLCCFSINSDTLYSMLSNEYQRKMRRIYGKTQNNRNYFWSMFSEKIGREGPGILVKIAEEHEIPPCLIAKLILQKYYEEKAEEENLDKEPVTKLYHYLKNTTLISDGQLAQEIFLVGTGLYFCSFFWESFWASF